MSAWGCLLQQDVPPISTADRLHQSEENV